MQTVLVTGGAVRVGKAIALHLAQKGWHVIVHYRHSGQAAENLVRQIKEAGGKALSVQGDLAEEGASQRVFQQAGNVDVLINNAAVFERDTLATLTPESLEANMQTNLVAPLLMMQAFVQQLGEKKGHIINLLDGCKGMSVSAKFLSYALSKQSLREATFLLAQELAPQVQVNGVSVGLALPREGEEEMFERLRQKLPLQMATSPDEVAKSVAFLLESPSITGHIVPLNGGLS